MGAGKPWREVHCEEKPWTVKHLDKLKKAIPDISYKVDSKDVKGRIAVVGEIQAGKSSFINSVLSVLKGRIVQQAPEGEADESYTRQLLNFYCGNFLVSDTMGLELEHQGISFEDIKYMAKGHIAVDYKFDPREPISQESNDFVEKPGHKDGIHCFVFVAEASLEVPKKMIEKIKQLQTVIAGIAGGIPRILILTKIDKLDKDVKDDIGKTFYSSKVDQAVKMASNIYCIPELHVYPVKNFTYEQIPETKASILILMALRAALEFAQDQVEKLEEKLNHEKRERNDQN